MKAANESESDEGGEEEEAESAEGSGELESHRSEMQVARHRWYAGDLSPTEAHVSRTRRQVEMRAAEKKCIDHFLLPWSHEMGICRRQSFVALYQSESGAHITQWRRWCDGRLALSKMIERRHPADVNFGETQIHANQLDEAVR